VAVPAGANVASGGAAGIRLIRFTAAPRVLKTVIRPTNNFPRDSRARLSKARPRPIEAAHALAVQRRRGG